MNLHQQGTIHNLRSQSFPVVLDLEVTDDGHLSGFANFYGGVRPDGFPLGTSSQSLLTIRERALCKNFSISRFGLYTLRQHMFRVTSTVAGRNFRT